MCGYYGGWAPYVPVAKRRQQATKQVAKMKKNGMTILPVVIDGLKIAKTFWGKAWCDHLESCSDFENRLPRGRTYVCNGSVVHLDIGKGIINALVSGSSLYEVKVTISPITQQKWKTVVVSCAGSIGSMVELLQGKFSKSVMEIISSKEQGLFPSPQEIKVNCSCPDYATMCKHVSAVLYGIGARLDSQPELLFVLRQADHFDLLASATDSSNLDQNATEDMDTSQLSALFDIDIDESTKTDSTKIPATIKNKPIDHSRSTKSKPAPKSGTQRKPKKRQLKKRV